MELERRTDERQTQDDLKRMLNQQQKDALQQMEITGWKILFIRNQLFHPMITVLTNNADGAVVVLEEDGSVTPEYDLRLRLQDQ
jgi:hypothetical protein